MGDFIFLAILVLICFALFLLSGRLIGWALGIGELKSRLDKLIDIQTEIAIRQGLRMDSKGRWLQPGRQYTDHPDEPDEFDDATLDRLYKPAEGLREP